jgi:hypothetical protein
MKPIVGYLVWSDKKPFRIRLNETFAQKHMLDLARPDKDGNELTPKLFWALPVYDYASKEIKILEITQKSVQTGIEAYVNDADWGDPTGYDLKVVRSGKLLETRYTVSPVAPKPLDADIINDYKTLNINLDALFAGEDPFKVKPTTGLGSDAVSAEDLPF